MKKHIITLGCALAASLSSAQSTVIISEIDFSGGQVEFVNTGSSTTDLTNYWICNLVNGSPVYVQLASVVGNIDSATSTSTGFSLDSGEVLVLNLTGALVNFVSSSTNGEFGLYNTNTFGVSTAIEDYVLWGAAGQRDSVAQGAGIWNDNEFVDVSGLGAGQSLQLNFGAAGNQASDYSVASSNIGVAQSVPEPSSAALLALGSLSLIMRRKK